MKVFDAYVWDSTSSAPRKYESVAFVETTDRGSLELKNSDGNVVAEHAVGMWALWSSDNRREQEESAK